MKRQTTEHFAPPRRRQVASQCSRPGNRVLVRSAGDRFSFPGNQPSDPVSQFEGIAASAGKITRSPTCERLQAGIASQLKIPQGIAASNRAAVREVWRAFDARPGAYYAHARIICAPARIFADSCASHSYVRTSREFPASSGGIMEFENQEGITTQVIAGQSEAATAPPALTSPSPEKLCAYAHI